MAVEFKDASEDAKDDNARISSVEDAQPPSRFSSSGFRLRRVCRYLLKANATRHILAPLRTVYIIASRSREPLVRAKGAGPRWWRVAGCLRLAQCCSSVLESSTPTTERPCASAGAATSKLTRSGGCVAVCRQSLDLSGALL